MYKTQPGFVQRLLFYGRFLRAIMASRLGLLKAPFKYILVVTKRCNSKCRNCLIWTEKVQNELTLDEYDQIAQKSKNLLWLNLTGGEVTLRDDVVEIVKTFKKHCPHLQILNFTTNGIDPEKIATTVRALRDIGFIKFTVNISLDGPKEIHDRLRGVPGNFESAIETFKKLKQVAGVDCAFSFTIYRTNEHSFDAMISEVRRTIPGIRDSDFHLNLENTSTHFYGNARVKKDVSTAGDKTASAVGLMKRFTQLSFGALTSPDRYFKYLYHRLALQFLKSGRTPTTCMALANSVYISEHGDMYPCIVWNKKVGSLRDRSFDVAALASSAAAIQLKLDIQEKRCVNCWTPCEAYHSMVTRPLGI